MATVIHHGGSSSQQAVSNFSVVMMREADLEVHAEDPGSLVRFDLPLRNVSVRLWPPFSSLYASATKVAFSQRR